MKTKIDVLLERQSALWKEMSLLVKEINEHTKIDAFVINEVKEALINTEYELISDDHGSARIAAEACFDHMSDYELLTIVEDWDDNSDDVYILATKAISDYHAEQILLKDE